MRFRKLRIAFSITCGIVCLLLIVLWVGSYYGIDVVQGPLPRGMEYSVISTQALIAGESGWLVHSTNNEHMDYGVLRRPLPDDDIRETWRFVAPYGFAVKKDRYVSILYFRIPHVLALFCFAILSALPWIRWSKQFRLRTVLIATTLVAVVLGLIVWLR
jgi:hypothetical protein